MCCVLVKVFSDNYGGPYIEYVELFPSFEKAKKLMESDSKSDYKSAIIDWEKNKKEGKNKPYFDFDKDYENLLVLVNCGKTTVWSIYEF